MSTGTVLWTNSSPTSTFSSQTVTLSDSITNYNYLKFVVYTNTTNSNSFNVIIPVEDFVTTTGSKDTTFCQFVLGATAGYTLSTGTLFSRACWYDTDTTIEFHNSGGWNVAGASTETNIPYQIIGIK